jgi:hypothetical protein
MTNRTWIGGGNNQASNPKDWSPKGAPHSGDALTMNSGTMNVIHDDLAGDVLAINSGTVNLTRGSNATIAANGDALINIQGTDRGDRTGRGVDQGPGAFPDDPGRVFSGCSFSTLPFSAGSCRLLNVVPTGWVNTFPTVPPPPVGGSATVNLAVNSMWVGGIFSVGALTINGGSNSVFQNNGLTFLGESFVFAGHTTINANVGGTGQTEVEGGDYSPTLEFGASVGSNQKITLSNPETIPGTKSLLVLDNPVGFHGLVVSNFLPAPGIPTEIDLRGVGYGRWL